APDAEAMERLYAAWELEVARPLLLEPRRPDAVRRLLRGKALVDGIRAAAHDARLRLDAELSRRIRASSTISGIALGTVVVLVCLFGAAGLRYGRERIIEEVALKEQVAQRNLALERSNASLEEFAYVASHDLQEPLRAIAGFSNLLSERYVGRLDAEADEFIAFIVDGTERMRGLIDDILRYSRVTTHGKPLAAVELGGAIDRALVNLQATIAARSARVEVGPMPQVEGDATQLVQLFQNLIGNAIKYNRSEPPLVEVAARRGEDGAWVISVRDNGIGIAPEYHERIFRVFARLHTRTEFPGSGIGLALVRRIVERHGGRIWVDSVEGQGATFSLTLRPYTAKGSA
ncbi:MAG TPA: ATP-binding protein, partial [Verrucomicrobiae bacterium]|nr:ATP-binding protein [Verrucomicrobiae bacterium]